MDFRPYIQQYTSPNEKKINIALVYSIIWWTSTKFVQIMLLGTKMAHAWVIFITLAHECCLVSCVIFMGVWTSFAKKPYIYVISGESRPLSPLWIRAWVASSSQYLFPLRNNFVLKKSSAANFRWLFLKLFGLNIFYLINHFYISTMS